MKSSFFGDSLFPKIGIEIKSLRDLQEAPSIQVGRDETYVRTVRDMHGFGPVASLGPSLRRGVININSWDGTLDLRLLTESQAA